MNNEWKYCAVGNIVKTRVDENGIEWHGTAAFRPGAKVYLKGKIWNEGDKEIDAIGLTRGRKYKVVDTPVEMIENVRLSRVYTPQIIDIMGCLEYSRYWWDNSPTDRHEVTEFVERWNSSRKS